MVSCHLGRAHQMTYGPKPVSVADDEQKSLRKYRTVDRKIKGDPFARSKVGEIVKPGELVDIVELSPLTLNDRRNYNLLIANAWDRITEATEHRIRKADLKGSHESNDRLEDSIKRLMGAIAEIRVIKEGRRAIERVQLLGPNTTHNDDESGFLYYTFPEPLRNIIQQSEIFARLKTQVMYCFTSKYALCLYEILQKRVNLEHRQTETFTVTELRSLLNVPEGKLERYADFNRYALKPALKEVNALSDYAVYLTPKKAGRTVTHLILFWMQKDLEGRLSALQELERCSVGRTARIDGKVEKAVA